MMTEFNGNEGECPQCHRPVRPGETYCDSCKLNRILNADSAGPDQNVYQKLWKWSRIGRWAIFLIIVSFILINFFIFPPQAQVAGQSFSAGTGPDTFQWTYGPNAYSLSCNISHEKYLQYHDNGTQRSIIWEDDYHYIDGYVTINDSAIQDIATSLSRLSFYSGFDPWQEATLVLRFVQSIPYGLDQTTTGQSDYWRFPIETLHDRTGDCEDTAVLYATLMEAMGYDCAILLFNEHVAAGLLCEGEGGTYYHYGDGHYFYCETTSSGWGIGDLPGSIAVFDGIVQVGV